MSKKKKPPGRLKSSVAARLVDHDSNSSDESSSSDNKNISSLVHVSDDDDCQIINPPEPQSASTTTSTPQRSSQRLEEPATRKRSYDDVAASIEGTNSDNLPFFEPEINDQTPNNPPPKRPRITHEKKKAVISMEAPKAQRKALQFQSTPATFSLLESKADEEIIEEHGDVSRAAMSEISTSAERESAKIGDKDNNYQIGQVKAALKKLDKLNVIGMCEGNPRSFLLKDVKFSLYNSGKRIYSSFHCPTCYGIFSSNRVNKIKNSQAVCLIYLYNNEIYGHPEYMHICNLPTTSFSTTEKLLAVPVKSRKYASTEIAEESAEIGDKNVSYLNRQAQVALNKLQLNFISEIKNYQAVCLIYLYNNEIYGHQEYNHICNLPTSFSPTEKLRVVPVKTRKYAAVETDAEIGELDDGIDTEESASAKTGEFVEMAEESAEMVGENDEIGSYEPKNFETSQAVSAETDESSVAEDVDEMVEETADVADNEADRSNTVTIIEKQKIKDGSYEFMDGKFSSSGLLFRKAGNPRKNANFIRYACKICLALHKNLQSKKLGHIYFYNGNFYGDPSEPQGIPHLCLRGLTDSQMQNDEELMRIENDTVITVEELMQMLKDPNSCYPELAAFLNELRDQCGGKEHHDIYIAFTRDHGTIREMLASIVWIGRADEIELRAKSHKRKNGPLQNVIATHGKLFFAPLVQNGNFEICRNIEALLLSLAAMDGFFVKWSDLKNSIIERIRNDDLRKWLLNEEDEYAVENDLLVKGLKQMVHSAMRMRSNFITSTK